MRLVRIESRQNKDWSRHFVDDTDYDVLITDEATVLKPDGTFLFKVLKNCLSPAAVSSAWEMIDGYNVKTNNRGVASGAEYIKETKSDGTISKTQRVKKGFEVISGTLGFFERTPRFPFCRACQYNIDHPDRFSKLLPVTQEASAVFAREGGERYEFQRQLVEKTSKDFVIPGTVFTTVTLNKNFRTAAHMDAGDLTGGLSCMALLRKGRFTGGDFVYPDFRAAVRLEHGDLIIFDPHEFHANTQIVPLGKNYCRSTLVFYYREKIQYCGAAEFELQRAKSRKTGDALT